MSLCVWKLTENVRKSDGLPIWVCSNLGCKNKAATVKRPGDVFCNALGKSNAVTIKMSSPRLPKSKTLDQSKINLVTFCVTHFDRPDHLARCLESIRKYYPSATIIVGDNSVIGRPHVSDDVTLLIAEPDCGLSSLRNQLVAAATTPYVAILEEDFVFTEETDIGKLIGLLDSEQSIGLAAGSLWTDGVLHKWSRVFTNGNDGKLHVHDKNGPYNVASDGTLWQTCDVVLNFFVARRKLLDANPWPAEIKIGGEHYAWFNKIADMKAFLVAHVPSVTALHDRSGRNEHYQAYRRRVDWSKVNVDLVHDGGAGIWNKRQNVVILGVGHSGTTILSKMLDAFGWKVRSNDPEYYEDRRVREANAAMLDGRAVDAAEIIRWLPAGWLIKDPRMVVTMPQWLEAFAMTAAKFGSAPTLVYIERNLDDVLESYRRRGEPLHKSYGGLSVREVAKLAERRFQEWPWQKVQVRYEDIAAAVGLWAPTKHKPPEAIQQCKHLGEKLGEVGCGCGAREKMMPVFACSVFGQCTERSSGKPQRYNGEKIAVCLGCPQRT